ncbi:MAG: RluA family pseudouridine synthase [Phycisphaerales bacterium]|nr:RluA family pseudouridine synthase [Phycisphaerales bacterium]
MPQVSPNPRVTFAIRYEDDHLLVVEKPSGRVTQPGIGHLHDTLLNGLYAKYEHRLSQLGEKRDHGLVHRLDRETSGVLAIALSRPAYDGLRAAFEARTVRKFYWAVVKKAPTEPKGVIRLPIEESVRRKDRYTSVKRAKISSEGKPALTAYRLLAESPYAAMIEARPITGRMHQIRVHMNAINAPVLGDDLYAPATLQNSAPRLALHAHRIAFEHPVTGEAIDIRSPWPRDLRSLLRKLSLPRPDLPGEQSGQPRDEDDSTDAGDELRGDPIGEQDTGLGQ